MNYKEAEALISEAHKLGYRGTEWEQRLISRLSLMQPAVLLPQDAASVTEFYRRAAGGKNWEHRQIINCKHRYNPY